MIDGHIIHTIWKQRPRGLLHHHYLYLPRHGRSSYDMEYQGETALSVHQQYLLQRGTVYTMHASDLHSSESPFRKRVMTILLEDRGDLRSVADVYCHKYQGVRPRLSSPELSREEFSTVIEELRAWLTAEPPR